MGHRSRAWSCDGSVTVPLFHTSRAGIGDGSAPLAANSVDGPFAAVQTRLEHAGMLLGVDAPTNADLVGNVLVRSADCPLTEWRNADPGAGARFVRAVRFIFQGVGTVPDAKQQEYSEKVIGGTLLACTLFGVTLTGKGQYDMGTPLTEGFIARGSVQAGPTSASLNLVAFSRGWETFFEGILDGMLAAGQVTLLGQTPTLDHFSCDPAIYKPGAMKAQVTTALGAEEGTLLPVLTVSPFLPTTTYTCNGITEPN